MCQTCGCSADAEQRVTKVDQAEGHDEHSHDDHDHEHGHHHHHRSHDATHSHPTTPRTLHLEQAILAKNDRLAEQIRSRLKANGIVAWNLMSSPGAGKTTLLERTIRDLGGELPIAVIEGDQETTRDAERIRDAGCPVVQVNTGAGCHLDASMLADALHQLEPPSGSLLLIENVGNLVCPALFDLGERGKVVIASVTEGEDKPLKYPHMFRAAEVMLLNKIDLLPHVNFDVDRCIEYGRRVNPALRVIEVSATRGDGLEQWYDFLRAQVEVVGPAEGTGSWQPFW